MCNYVFDKLDLDYRDYVEVDKDILGAEELKYLKVILQNLEKHLDGKSEYTFETLMDDMINHWLTKIN